MKKIISIVTFCLGITIVALLYTPWGIGTTTNNLVKNLGASVLFYCIALGAFSNIKSSWKEILDPEYCVHTLVVGILASATIFGLVNNTTDYFFYCGFGGYMLSVAIYYIRRSSALKKKKNIKTT